ncbi:MAG: ABC transporter permease [Deltaproteobacteria bacterium]|nr:ABC transporter permease [Candidatus Anaeroferrophillus wilburensis]MBN2889710.1 ABC transporter permease [Deltaproteobacteria bacterium]
MIVFIGKRIALMVPMLVGITMISFLVMNLAPGEPIDLLTNLNPKATAEVRERLRIHYGLDKPLPIRYVNWLKRVVRLDLGTSFAQDNRPVWDKIRERIPITLTINALSLLLIIIAALPIGIFSAVRQHSLWDRLLTIFVFLGFATPTFWLALLLMILFGVHLGWLPISGLQSPHAADAGFWIVFIDRARHLLLPVLVSAFGGLAGLSRYMRSNMLEVIRQDYITTARAKGLKESVVIGKHALRNALMPIITILGFSLPGLIGGSVIFETIFAIPGMGQMFYGAVMARDYPLIMGTLVIGAVLTLVGNLLADISYALVDPRIRVGHHE